MKRSMGLIFLIVLIVLVAGCSRQSGGEVSPTSVPDPTSKPAAPSDTPKPAEPTTEPSATPESAATQPPSAAFEITSAAYADGEAVPDRYSCAGDDVSPPLSWSDPPAGTQTFALIFDDPDAPAGTWIHWVLYQLPAETRALPEAADSEDALPDGTLRGENSWGRGDYGGPCPPGGTHRYFFRLYALDTTLDLESGANKEQLLAAMEGHVLAQAELMGTYTK